ncbi:MAG: phosphate ABC transporter substrate-binding protein PstS family protein [Blautia sp.]|nr:phosphate ABC transporter substrate-binding protein PstS family protein [Blautia sp.]MDY4515410.1 phosphate ABC transporter substrate-binding protein PstS family protein [Lachnospiraceae bacterium]
MKKLLAMAAIGAMALGLTACGSKTAETTAPAASPEAETTASAAETEAETDAAEAIDAAEASEDVSGTIVITGSTSVEKILNEMKDEFEAQNPDVTIEYTGSGSSAGITDTKAGTNNIGASSRELKDEEKEDALKTEVFAYDGIAVIVNPANEAVEDISEEQLADIYSGKITNWKDLGGNDADIFVVSREESSGTRSAFEELIGLEDAGGLTGNAAVSEGNGPVQAAVAGNENAIGYVSFSFIDDTVKPLTVGGVEATAENAKSGSYPLSRPFLFCYYEDKVTDAGKAFLAFALSEDGQAAVEEHGGIKVTE